MKFLGNLTPSPVLLAEVAREGVSLNDFTGTMALPQEFHDFLNTHGYEPTERLGMLFAHDAGVGQHTDESYIACWFLCGTNRRYMGDGSHELIVGDKHLTVGDGDVVFFNGRRKYALVASLPGLWACYSIYVKAKRAR